MIALNRIPARIHLNQVLDRWLIASTKRPTPAVNVAIAAAAIKVAETFERRHPEEETDMSLTSAMETFRAKYPAKWAEVAAGRTVWWKAYIYENRDLLKKKNAFRLLAKEAGLSWPSLKRVASIYRNDREAFFNS